MFLKKCYRLVLVLIFAINATNAQNTGPNTIDYCGNSGITEENVDLVTGDYYYGITLFTLPSENGAFPVTISYKSGITMDQEASWVGLGWSLFPGAIFRNVNGFPDDWNQKRTMEISEFSPYSIEPGYGNDSYASVGLQYILGRSELFNKNTRKTVRYFEQDSKEVSGVIYMNEEKEYSGTANSQTDYKLMDVYSETLTDAATEMEYELTGKPMIFPNYDNYTVNCPGISCKIAPRIYKLGEISSGNVTFSAYPYLDKLTNHYNSYGNHNIDVASKSNNKVHFYDIYEKSSYYHVLSGVFASDYSNTCKPITPTNNAFNCDYIVDANDTHVSDVLDPGGNWEAEYDWTMEKDETEYSNYNETTHRVGSAKYVEWFSNDEIINDPNSDIHERGFVETELLSGQRTDADLFDNDGIGAYTITDINGVSYHFSLPVYQFEFKQRDQVTIPGLPQYKYEQVWYDKYAYAWLLTSITGPDYIDDNNDGLINDDDLGYWVKFNYGKWTDGYIWKTPENEYTDISLFEHINYQWGRKQIYYLNSIETSTHKAFFIKSLRSDGKGEDITANSDNYTINHYIPFDNDYINYIWETEWKSGSENGSSFTNYNSYNISKYINFQVTDNVPETQVLKLNKIIVVKNEDIGTISTSNSGSNAVSIINNDIGGYKFVETAAIQESSNNDNLFLTKDFDFNTYFQDNVLDVGDNISTIVNSAISVIDFSFTSDLCKEPNSNIGKLCLNDIQIKGYESEEKYPKYDFTYYNNENYITENMDDWGFHKDIPESWSLKKIISPIGSETTIVYESDEYINKAVYALSGEFSGGGLRVSEISVKDENSNEYKKKFEYLSGMTSFSPTKNYSFIPLKFDLPEPKVLYSSVVTKDLSLSGNEDDFEYESMYEFDNYSPNTTSTNTFDIDVISASYTDYGKGCITTNFNNSLSQYSELEFINNNQLFYHFGEIECTFDLLSSATITINCFDAADIITSAEIQEIVTDKNFNYFYFYNISDIERGDNGTVYISDDYWYCHATPGNYCVTDKYTYCEDLNMEEYARNYFIINNTDKLGRLKSKTVRNSFGENISSTKYNYGNFGVGTKTETFINRKSISQNNYPSSSEIDWILTSSSKTYSPSLLYSIEEYNQNAISDVVYNYDFDFNTGISLKSWNKNYRNVIVPAYTKYGSMGLRSLDYNNKNMLSQVAQTMKLKCESVSDDENIDLEDLTCNDYISNSITSWNNNWNYKEPSCNGTNPEYSDVNYPSDIWRPYKSYLWQGDVKENGSYKLGFTNYNFTMTDQDQYNGWEKTSEIVRYDRKSRVLETKDINGNFSSVKYGYDDKYMIANAVNSNYQNFAFTGFEFYTDRKYDCPLCPKGMTQYDFGSEIIVHSGFENYVQLINDANLSHTGDYYLKVVDSKGPIFRIYYNSTETDKGLQDGWYRASVWVHNTTSDLDLIAMKNATTVLKQISYSEAISVQGSNWKLLNLDFEVTNSTTSDYVDIYVECPAAGDIAYIDDFRVQPINSVVTCYIYNNETGLVEAELNTENFTTLYTRDNQGAIVEISKETVKYGLKKVVEYDYHYAREDE